MQATAIANSLAPLIAPGGAAGTALAGTGTPGAAPFGDLLRTAVDGVDGLDQQASAAVEGLMRGTGVDVHDAMITTQKADMSFELALAVRNKAVAAYQQVMGMQF